jgi:hypothetical protein
VRRRSSGGVLHRRPIEAQKLIAPQESIFTSFSIDAINLPVDTVAQAVTRDASRRPQSAAAHLPPGGCTDGAAAAVRPRTVTGMPFALQTRRPDGGAARPTSASHLSPGAGRTLLNRISPLSLGVTQSFLSLRPQHLCGEHDRDEGGTSQPSASLSS